MILTSLSGSTVSKLGTMSLVVMACALADFAYGHHSFVMFDMESTVNIEGRLLQFDLRNPHVYLSVETTDESGEVEVWGIEGTTARRLQRRGISESDLVTGDWISVEVHPPKNEERRLAAGELITKLDGTVLVLGFQGGADIPAPTVAAVATDLSGTWRGEFGLRQIDSPDQLSLWPLTEKGRAALERYDGSQTPSVNCVPYTAPASMLIGDQSVEINESSVIIRDTIENADRIIYVDGQPHPENAEPSNQGHSIGWWEDDVLVVDTIHFTENLVGNAFGVPGGFAKHLTERFSLSEDGTQIDYSFALEDPEFLTGPVTGESQWNYRPDLELDSIGCDPESARRFLDAY